MNELARVAAYVIIAQMPPGADLTLDELRRRLLVLPQATIAQGPWIGGDQVAVTFNVGSLGPEECMEGVAEVVRGVREEGSGG